VLGDLRAASRPVIYPVNEVFSTIQGEASFAGTPAVFVRLQGCQVGCAFCDTKHTWDVAPEKRRGLGVIMDKTWAPMPTYADVEAAALVEQVLAEARGGMSPVGARHVVITGGEPAYYDLVPLAVPLLQHGFTVQVETSGTCLVHIPDSAFVTVSPKINQAGGKEIIPSVIMRADEIKHPTAVESDLRELLALLAKGWHRPEIPIWLQPLSQSPAATARCVAWCRDYGFRLSIQTHKYLGLR
jgi:7-carboxy-7-deazaguanine synthase